MEQIEIIKRDGTVIRCFNIEPFCTPTQAVQEKTLMSDDTVKITLRSSQPYKFEKGDKVVINGYTYKIRTTPERTLQSNGDYIHNLTLYGVMYDLMKCQYRNTDANGNSTRSIFDLTYSIKDFVKVAIYNLNRDNPGEWDFDEDNCPDTEPITVSFSNNNVLQVIQDLCSEDKFNLEFRITTEDGVNTIHIGTFGSVVTPPSGEDYFEWGKGNGLWQLQEKKVDDRAIVTRLWAEGGTQNIKSGYRDYSDRLQFPYPRRLNTRAHTLKDGTVIPAGSQTIGITADSKRYIEDTELSEEIGVEEETKTFDDIYPRRTGTVSALGASVLEFVDDSMDFDLNAKDEDGNTLYLIAGTSAKITFITGKLAGQQFQLSAYDHESQTFKLIAYTDERGLTIPTEDTDAFRFAVGDKYKITDINMPESYIQDAEEDLWYAAMDYFNEAKQARYKYELTFDREYFLDNVSDRDSSIFEVGDYVPIKDTRFGVERNIRIQKVSRNLLLDQDYTLTLSDTPSISIVARSILDVVEHDKIIQNNELKNPTRNKRRWSDIKETVNALQGAVEGFTEGITPVTVNTMSLLVGSESEQFKVYDDEFEAEIPFPWSGLTVGASGIRHFTLGITSDKITTPGANADLQYKEWTLEEKDLSEAVTEATKAYYIYAKVEKTYTGDTGTGEYIASLTIKPLEQDGYYYLLAGILSSQSEAGTRSFAPLYGYTEILPNQIRTGAIVSADGKTYFDLATGILSLNDNAGISGTAETGKTQAKSIAAWYGGQRVDLENLLSGQSAQNAASALFRFDGTGYLAKGNITWDANGYGQVGGRGDNYAVKWDANGVRLGSGIKIGAGDETVAMLVQLLQMFELDTTSVAGKTLIKAKYDGLYSMGEITAGGIGTGGTGGGGLIERIYRIANLGDTIAPGNDTFDANTINSLHARISSLENAPSGGVTSFNSRTGAVTLLKTDIENVLTGNITSHAHSQYLTASALSGYATESWVTQQASAIMGNYLPLSGGTISGNLIISTKLTPPVTNNADINFSERTEIRLFHGGSSEWEELHYPYDYASGVSFYESNTNLQIAWRRSVVGDSVLSCRVSEAGIYGDWHILYHSGNLTAATLGAETTDHADANYQTIGISLQSLQSQIDSVASRDFSEFTESLLSLKMWIEDMFELTADGIHAKYALYSDSEITAGGVGSGGGSTGGVASIVLDGATQPMSDDGIVTLDLSAYAKKTDATSVSYSAVGTGSAIGTLTIDSVPNSISLTKANVEAVLTGVISSHTHSYPVSSVAGLTGSITTAQIATKLTDAGYELTDTIYELTKQKVEAVLTGDITSHTHSQYLTGITSSMVTTALGFTPYNASNPAGYITSSALSGYAPLTQIISFSDSPNYVVANFNDGALSRKAASAYIECWDNEGGWWNWKAGKWITVNGTATQFVKGDGTLDASTYAKFSEVSTPDTSYDFGFYSMRSGSGSPTGTQYGAWLTIPFAKAIGNNAQQYAWQIFGPNGDDTNYPDDIFVRTSWYSTWREWHRLYHTGNLTAATLGAETTAHAAATYARLADHNNLMANANEFTFASSAFSGPIYINYRTAGGLNGNISNYYFCDGGGGVLWNLSSIASLASNGNAAYNDLATVSKVLQSLQSQIDSVASRDFSELAEAFLSLKMWIEDMFEKTSDGIHAKYSLYTSGELTAGA